MVLTLVFYIAHARASYYHKLDLTHEWLLVVQACLMLVYTGAVADPHVKHTMGWVSAIFFTLQFLISFTIIVGGVLKDIKLNLKRCCSRIKKCKKQPQDKALTESTTTKDDAGKEQQPD